MRLHRFLLLVWLRAATPCVAQEPFGAEDFGARDDAVHIPEPLVFDLVRGLGAHRGELEVNVLGEFPLHGPEAAAWAPELEGAVADGLALEIEFPFEGSMLEAYKFALQWTFGAGFDDRFIHGTQFIAEKHRGTDVLELTGMYVPGLRFNRTFSALLMIGVRAFTGEDVDLDPQAIVNASLFADLGYRLSVGVETNTVGARDVGSSFLLMPQVHYELTDHFMVQAGAGARWCSEDARAEASLRAIYAF